METEKSGGYCAYKKILSEPLHPGKHLHSKYISWLLKNTAGA